MFPVVCYVVVCYGFLVNYWSFFAGSSGDGEPGNHLRQCFNGNGPWSENCSIHSMPTNAFIKSTTLSCCLLISWAVYSQSYTWSTDSITLANPNFEMDRYHDVLRYHDPFMYLTFPVIRPILERKLPLENGEGKNGNWLEGNFAYRFIIYKGKYYSPLFFQRTRFTVDVGLMPRLTRDVSSPLLPYNNKFGLGLDVLLTPLQNLQKENTMLSWFTVQVHHYSNGQSDSFFIESPVLRNNYRDGDFSTNYIRGLLHIAKSRQQKNILHAAVGYHHEFDPGGALGRSKELDNYYGDKRLLLEFQFTQKPIRRQKTHINRSNGNVDSIEVDIRKQFSFRTELDYILGDLSEFTGNNKYRLGWHTYFTFMPAVTNEVGFILHTYLGRDYLNIRFDDVVFIGGLGLFVKFNSK